jgi:putative peptidoglycan lipid II flippase
LTVAPWRGIAGASAVLAIGILAGRIAGLVREVTLASVLGVSEQADVAVLVLTLPDVLTAFLLSGTISAVLVPEFTRRIAADGARSALREAEVIVVLVGLALAAIVAIAARPIVAVIAPGLSDSAGDLAAKLVAASSLALPLAGLSGVAAAYLQSHRRFATTAAGTLVVNLVLVAVLALAVRPDSLGLIAVGIVLAGAARWLLQRVDAARTVDRSGSSTLRAHLSRFGGRYGIAALGTSTLVLVPFAMRALASLGSPGDIAIVNYALRILELPLGVFITVGSIAALPFLADLIARGEDGRAASLFRQLVLVTQIVTVPLALGGILAAAPIALLLYGRPAVGASVADIGSYAAIGMLSLPAQGVASVAQSYLIARGRLGLLLGINGIGLVGYLIVAAILVRAMGTSGVMFAYVALHWVVAVALLTAAAREGAGLGSAVLRDMSAALLLALAAFVGFWLVATVLATPPLVTFVIAVVGTLAALGVSLAPRYASIGGAGVLRLLFARQ